MMTTFTIAICVIGILNIILEKHVIYCSANMAKKAFVF